MIYNIIDRRKRPYRWKMIEAIIEAVQNDNCVEDADQEPEPYDWIGYDEKIDLSLHEAIRWAEEFPFPVTLFLYEVGGGTGCSTRKR